MPYYFFNYTVFLFAVCSNSAVPSGTFDSNQCKAAGLGEENVSSPPALPFSSLTWIIFPLKGG